ncbi:MULTISPECIES: alpha/beta fold hydrolase [Streptomyces]|uniref:Pimeloyl-ACP methyl ester carboxylesterase n=1 Tax=Streptomyces murinus TaxID=33900 RepID=A0A7W3NKN3_STRMR|nr:MULTISPECIES: alpha/beta fold hydrolase [Streptomyces]MBA9052280.1 pimeloyl-ACP methyl ester carboxylesterase [Streptomyces murinus]UWW93529.1 alpha/beta fold hydrolase [Streptomyces murinus]WSI84198.1 alpha/beta fold hydrolase [Streptomyces murinus]WUD05915.1 alpha/beta fold hydrolase [Streptomyces murinus]
MSATASFTVPTPRGPEDVAVSYARVGRGEPLVLLHGIGHHRQAWDPVVDILATEREVIAVDLPGFGASPALPPALGYDLPTTNAVLGALFETLELDRPHIAGNSLGGLLALELGREKLVRSVTALSPAGFWTEAERRYAFATLLAMRGIAQRLPVPVVERLSRSTAGRTALMSTIYARPARRDPAAVVAETRALVEATGFTATLRSGNAVRFTDPLPGLPVTVAWGSRDRLLLRRQGVRAKQTIPHARLIRLPGCGHCPMNDDPALVARVILDGSRGDSLRED